MRYAAVFLLIGFAQLALAWSYGGWGWLFAWSGISFAAVVGAYAGVGPRVFGKQSDGTLAPANVVLLLPFLLFTWAVWSLQTLLSRGQAAHQVDSGFWLGRRLRPSEVAAGVTLIIDLTAEFPEPSGTPRGRQYLCVPTLDSCAPDSNLPIEAIQRALQCDGGVLAHCANGSGRSSTVVAAILIARGVWADVHAAEDYLRSMRPGVRLYPAQRAAVQRWSEGLTDARSNSRQARQPTRRNQ
jgi:protein-tyrosine phosphatase